VHSYRVCGLSVESEIDLPSVVAGAPDCTPQVTIRRGRVPEALIEPTIVGPTWQIAGKQLLLRIPNVARFLLTDGDQIVFDPESDAGAEDVPLFILGTVFGILLHQRERITLHASAVEVNGAAIVFCGPSGAGKSTLAAALAQRGYRVIADDLCAVTFAADGVPIVHPDGRQLKLWAQAIEQLGLEDVRGERVRSRLEKFYVDPGHAAREALPLRALYVLCQAYPSANPGIVRPNVVDAALLLRQHAYRPLLVARLKQKEAYFHAAAQIVDKAGVFRLTRRLDFAVMADVVSWLERHWGEVGVTEKAA
jgi:hypothetical protein